MSSVKRSGLKPLRSSTNLINNQSLLETRKSLDHGPADNKSERKVSQTEQLPTIKSTKSFKSIVNELNSNKVQTKCVDKKINKPATSNVKQIKKSSQSVEKKKVKKAIQTVLSRDQRIKKWLTSKQPVEDPEYWRLRSERLSDELTEQLDRLDELELENELLIAELEHFSKLAESAYKLSSLIERIGFPKLTKNDDSVDQTDDSINQTDDSINQTLNDSLDSRWFQSMSKLIVYIKGSVAGSIEDPPL